MRTIATLGSFRSPLKVRGWTVSFDGPNVCGLAAESAFYCVPSEYEALATFEFFRPSYQYLRDRFTDPRVIEHIEGGGLCLRRIGELDAIGADPVKTNGK